MYQIPQTNQITNRATPKTSLHPYTVQGFFFLLRFAHDGAPVPISFSQIRFKPKNYDFSKMRNRYKEEQNFPESPAYKYMVARGRGRGRSQSPYLQNYTERVSHKYTPCILKIHRTAPERLPGLFLESRSHSNWSATTYIRTQLPPSQWTKAKYLEYLSKISPDHIWNLLPTTTEISSEECVKFPHRGQNKPFVSKRTNPHNSIFCFSFISIKSNVNKIRIKTY